MNYLALGVLLFMLKKPAVNEILQAFHEHQKIVGKYYSLTPAAFRILAKGQNPVKLY